MPTSPLLSLFSRSGLSGSLWLHGLQHTRLPVLHHLLKFAQTHVHSVSDIIQLFHPPSSPPPPALNLSQHQGLFQPSGGQSLGASASASVLPVNIQDWFPLGWTGFISLQSKGPSKVFSNTKVQKHQFFMVQFSHPYVTTGKTIVLTRWTFVS